MPVEAIGGPDCSFEPRGHSLDPARLLKLKVLSHLHRHVNHQVQRFCCWVLVGSCYWDLEGSTFPAQKSQQLELGSSPAKGRLES